LTVGLLSFSSFIGAAVTAACMFFVTYEAWRCAQDGASGRTLERLEGLRITQETPRRGIRSLILHLHAHAVQRIALNHEKRRRKH
jgi:hypothetical protein